MPEPFRIRSIVDENRYTSDRKRLGSSDRLIDQALEGATWVIARDPARGVLVPGTDVRAIATDGTDGFRHGLVLYYRETDANHISLLGVIRGSDDEDANAED